MRCATSPRGTGRARVGRLRGRAATGRSAARARHITARRNAGLYRAACCSIALRDVCCCVTCAAARAPVALRSACTPRPSSSAGWHGCGRRRAALLSRTCSGARQLPAAPERRLALSAKKTGAAARLAESEGPNQRDRSVCALTQSLIRGTIAARRSAATSRLLYLDSPPGRPKPPLKLKPKWLL